MVEPPLLVADRIRVEFGKLVAVRDVSLDLSAGQLLGLIGPNGAGKTTLLRALAGLHAPTAGKATIMGLDVLGTADDVRHHLGFAPDAPPAYDQITVDDFLTFIARAYGLPWAEASERIDYWLEQTWLTERRTEKISTLSRGMKQRVTIARTLIPNPNVVLLDEPSQGLDPAGRIQLRQIVASLAAQGKGVIVSSHILADLEEYCTHIAIIEQGSILQFGPAGNLTGRAPNRHRYRLVLAEDRRNVSELLSAVEGLSDLTHVDGAYVFDYHDDRSAAARLLGELVGGGLPVAEFGPLPETLEETYLKAGVKQVD